MKSSVAELTRMTASIVPASYADRRRLVLRHERLLAGSQTGIARGNLVRAAKESAELWYLTPMLLLHISDIHFRAPDCVNADLDPDRPFRTRMVQDARARTATLGPVDAILIGGDIAFKGDPQEYAAAEAWLKELALASGCPWDRVYVVPGNHDVDRSLIARTPAPMQVPALVTHTGSDTTLEPEAAAVATAEPEVEAAVSDEDTHDLVYRFWGLTVSQRREITLRLGLIDAIELPIPEPERYGRRQSPKPHGRAGTVRERPGASARLISDIPSDFVPCWRGVCVRPERFKPYAAMPSAITRCPASLERALTAC